MADYMDKGLKRIGITISKPMLAIICIIFGVLVIVFPSLLVWIVGLFLVVQGALLLADIFEQERPVTPMTIPNAVYCSQCGTRNTEEAVYCRNCGKTLEQVKQKKKA
jgi:ribosomal protein L40E